MDPKDKQIQNLTVLVKTLNATIKELQETIKALEEASKELRRQHRKDSHTPILSCQVKSRIRPDHGGCRSGMRRTT